MGGTWLGPGGLIDGVGCRLATVMGGFGCSLTVVLGGAWCGLDE